MNCNYCGDKTSLKNGDIEGYIGMTEIAFCIDCYRLVSGWILHIEKLKEKGDDFEPPIQAEG